MKINLVRQSKIELAYGRKIIVDNFDDIKSSLNHLITLRCREDNPKYSGDAGLCRDASVIVPDRYLLDDAPDTFEVDGYNLDSYDLYLVVTKPITRIQPISSVRNQQVGDWTFQVPIGTVKITLDGRGNVMAWPTKDL